jgi:hypothetical protein
LVDSEVRLLLNGIPLVREVKKIRRRQHAAKPSHGVTIQRAPDGRQDRQAGTNRQAAKQRLPERERERETEAAGENAQSTSSDPAAPEVPKVLQIFVFVDICDVYVLFLAVPHSPTQYKYYMHILLKSHAA